MSNITLTRRRNALALFQEYAERELSSGSPPKGLEQSFAAKLQVSPSMWSQIKSSRPIGDKLAQQIEAHCAKPEGWLDREREAPVVSDAENTFLDLALRATVRRDADAPRVFARLPTVIQVTGLGRSTIYRMVASGVFPAPVQVGLRAVAWRWVDLDQWSESRRSALIDGRSALRAGSRAGAARPQAHP